MILAALNVDPTLSGFVLLSLIIIMVGFVARLLKQPSIVTYIIVGVLVGPFGFELITDKELITNLGSLGLVLLLFFIGMEINLPELIGNWKISVIGTLIQILASIFIVWLAGHYFNWSINQVVMLGFVISLSSTAVIIKLLQERKELHTRAGKNVISILLAQDVLIVPMLIVISYLGGHQPSRIEILGQVLGGLLIVGILAYISVKKEIKLPFRVYIAKDHEMQVFVAFTLCFGFSILTAVIGLSSALGAFVAGIVLSSARSTEWVHDSLNAFKVMFVALFFVSVGLLIDLKFLMDNALTVGTLVLFVFLLNNTINVLVIRIFCKDWRISLYAGAILSQIGEFSFILGSTGYQAGIIKDYAYQLIISTIALSLFLSPFWINLSRKIVGKEISQS